eukprot:m.51244 g.51244  ORF g.51244 m.51244 type:complete len:234 (+) comp6291_c0_seq2:298-999(+)
MRDGRVDGTLLANQKKDIFRFLRGYNMFCNQPLTDRIDVLATRVKLLHLLLETSEDTVKCNASTGVHEHLHDGTHLGLLLLQIINASLKRQKPLSSRVLRLQTSDLELQGPSLLLRLGQLTQSILILGLVARSSEHIDGGVCLFRLGVRLRPRKLLTQVLVPLLLGLERTLKRNPIILLEFQECVNDVSRCLPVDDQRVTRLRLSPKSIKSLENIGFSQKRTPAWEASVSMPS